VCGIVGFAGVNDPGLLARMCDAIVHRGPDGEGQVELPDAGIALGMRRLAIIDVEGGGQPFVSADGRVHLVFNGEIYNFADVRAELESLGHRFHSRCDTEVVLEAYLEWGEAAWPRLHGMFALAIADRRGPAPRLVLVRDRVGIKPLYYIRRGRSLVFASEIKALTRWSGFSTDIDLAAVANYLRLRYVPGPGGLFCEVRKLEAGHQLVFAGGEATLTRWWTPPGAALAEPGMSRADAAATLGEALRLAVRRHMIADVPVGAFLSGGVDSNVIVALMAEASSLPVNTYSIGFPDFPDHDRELAGLTAHALGTNHRALDCREADMAMLPDIAWQLDEPIGDAIVVPMYVLAREARRSVKVVLSGEGADEILGGYLFHRKLYQIAALRRCVPGLAWHAAGAVVARLPAGLLDRLFDYPGALGADGRRKIAALVRGIGTDDLAALYRRSISLFDTEELAEGARRSLLAAAMLPADDDPAPPGGSPLQRLVAMQYRDWLPDDILNKLDKMTMAHSLEGRVPFMDEAVIAAAARLPDRHKIARGTNKRALRDFAAGLLPREVVESPKRAFYIPLESYVAAPAVADLVRRTFDPDRQRKRGLFRQEWLDELRRESSGAGFLRLKRLFAIVMLELWFERFCPEASWN
jgi:asparagine synthase (glutamine-hydrolysing)